MNIGVLGGTFDPVHAGHMAIAEEAVSQFDLTEVIFIPAGQPCFKDPQIVTAIEDRVNMLRLAIAGKPHFSLSLIEIERQGPSYTVLTMQELKARVQSQNELHFILGWDSLLSLPQWYQADRLLQLCRIIAAPRPGFSRPDLNQIEKQLPGLAGRVSVMLKPLVDISSTVIRERVSAGLPISGLVPPAVEQYILEKGLYRT